MKTVLNTLIFLGMFSSGLEIVAQKDSITMQRSARKLVREGNTLYEQQKFTDASVAYKKALNSSPSYNKASYNLGNALYQDKNYQEAIPQYELTAKTAKDKFTKAEAYHNIGNAMMETKNYQGAVDAFKNSLRNNPNDDETRYNLALAQKLLDKENQDNKDNKDNKENKDKKDKKDQNQDKKEGEDKDKKDDKNKDGKGDKDKKDQNQDKKEDDKNQKENPKPQQGKISPEQIKQLLESLQNEEKKTQQKMNAQKAKGEKLKQEKDW